MEVGSSSSSSSSGPSVRVPKPEDIASSSGGISEEDFHRSDSVPKLEDLIAGDSRLEELYKGDVALKRIAQGDPGNETEDEDGSLEDPPEPYCLRGHSLRFLPVAPYPSGSFVCNRCTDRHTGEVYNCETCLFDLCPNCALTAPSTESNAVVPSNSVPEMPSSWGRPRLGCTNPSHTLAVLDAAPYESGAYLCNLCLKTGEAEVYHCTSCTDFDLHPECANIAREIVSFTHPHHRLLLQPPYSRGYNAICDGCLENLGGSQWAYRCGNSGCDFDLHARCAKYATTIFHPIHEEHELVLINESTAGPNSHVRCDACDNPVDPKELVYHCEECGFDVHPNCATGDLVRS